MKEVAKVRDAIHSPSLDGSLFEELHN